MKKTALTITILLVAVTSFLAGRWLIPVQTVDPATTESREILYYIDPMNPGFRSDEPGIAPCGMPLEPFYADPAEMQTGSGPGLPPGAVKINTARQQLIGVRVASVGTGSVTHTLRLYGQIIPDETLTFRLNASTDSWIRDISDVTTGSIVMKGELLGQALAPSYYNAQVTFLIAMDNLDRIHEQLGGQTRQNQVDIADNQIRVAVQALQNLGITDIQIEELANTREAQPYLQIRAPANGVVLERNLTLNQWFKAGEEFYTIADIGKVWVYADVYEDEARHLHPGMKIKVRHKQMGKTFDATVSRVLPLFDQISKTLKVRLDIENPDYDLRPDMFVDVEIPVTRMADLYVPTDAIIDSGTRTIVYVDLGGGAFEPRIVTTGWRLGRQVQIISGLMSGEKIVIAGNFLIDSESRMRASATAHESQLSRDPVCGMYVDENMARMMERSVTHGEKSYYFCMDECRTEFEKDPGKYTSDQSEQQSGNVEHGQHMTGMEQSWLKALNIGHGARKKKSESMAHEKGTNAGFGNALTSRGVVDWDGPDERPRDWTGWGKFPGAKYLGMGQENKGKKPSTGSEAKPATAGSEATPATAGSEKKPGADLDSASSIMNHNRTEKPAAGQMPAPGSS